MKPVSDNEVHAEFQRRSELGGGVLSQADAADVRTALARSSISAEDKLLLWHYFNSTEATIIKIAKEVGMRPDVFRRKTAKALRTLRHPQNIKLFPEIP